jgi:DNA-binding NtrC family response regulator
MDNQISVLVVDDNNDFRNVTSRELERMGFSVFSSESGEDAKGKIATEAVDVVLLDIKMPGMDGFEALKIIKELSPDSEVIMLTAFGATNNVVKAMQLGADNYLTKPCKLDELEEVIKKTYKKKMLKMQNTALKQELSRQDRFPDFVGNSTKLRNVLSIIDKVAPTDSTVLIYGESGTGKELVARAIHRSSLRAKEPFVIIDCATLQENLLESELFGHEKGAYTGAASLKHGLFEVADSGTVFMDEIGEITPSIQAKLLRVLETAAFRRVGGNETLTVDIRLIAATNRNLRQLVDEGKFRQDLFYRLKVFSLLIPPLRERREDIPLLAQHFAENANANNGGAKSISKEAMQILTNYNWPGNVRELENVIKRTIILSEGNMITPKNLPSDIQTAYDFSLETEGKLPSLEEIEKRYIAKIMQEDGGHRGKAAKLLGISERNLYRKLKNRRIWELISDRMTGSPDKLSGTITSILENQSGKFGQYVSERA